MSQKLISFTVPVGLTEFNVIIDDGRIYNIQRTDVMIDNQTILAEVAYDHETGGTCLIQVTASFEDTTTTPAEENYEHISLDQITKNDSAPLLPPPPPPSSTVPTGILLGKLILEPIEGNDIILGYTIQDESMTSTSSTSTTQPANPLLSSLNSSLKSVTSLVTSELNKIDQTYHVRDKLRELDQQYHVSETAVGTTNSLINNISTINQQYKITETVQSTVQNVDERFHVHDNLKSATAYAANTTITASNALLSHASTINETYHVTDNVKSAVQLVSNKVIEIDEKFHVSETVKDTATVVVNEVKKVAETFQSTDENDGPHDSPAQAPGTIADPDMDEETHFYK